MDKEIENIIKKWLKEHQDGGQWVTDFDGEFDLDSCCLDGHFNLTELADEVLKVVVEKIREKCLKHILCLHDIDGGVCDCCEMNYYRIEELNLLSNLSPNKEN